MDNLKLNVDWELGEDKVKAGMAENRKAIEGVGQTIEVVEKKAAKNVEALVKKNNALSKSYLQLKVNAEFFGNIVQKSTDPGVIAKYNAKLEATRAEMARISNIGRSGFDEMGHAIKDTTVFSGRLVESLSAGVERLRRLAYIIPGLGITGLFAMAWGPLKRLIEGTGLLEKRLSESQKEAKRLGEAMGSNEYKKAITSISELKVNVELAKEGLYDKNTALEEYNSTIGQTAGTLKDFNEVEQALIDNADLYIDMTLKKAAATAAADEAAAATVELRKEMLKSEKEFANGMDRLMASTASYSGNMYGTSTFDIEAFNEVLEEEGAKRKKAYEEEKEKDIKALKDIAADFQKEAADIAKKMGGILGLNEKKPTPTNKAVTDAYNLFQKLADLQAEYARKSMGKDEAELQALRDRFAKIAREVEIFNLNPKNKIKIPIEQVEEIRDKALADLQYQQNTYNAAKLYEQDLQNFLSYEKLKAEAGAEYADKRYADELESIRAFEEKLRSEIGDLALMGDGSALEAERLAAYESILKKLEDYRLEEADKEYIAEQQRVEKLLTTLVTYDQERTKMIEEYERDKKILSEKGKLDELSVLDAKHKEELDKLDDANVEKLASYKELFEGVEKLSDAAAQEVIAKLKEMLLLDEMSEGMRNKITGLIKDAESTLSDRMLDRVMDVAQGFDEMARSAAGVNEELADMLGLVGDVLKATVNVKDGFDRLGEGIGNYKEWKSAGADKQGGILGGISAIAGVAGPAGQIVGAVSSVMKGVFGFLDGAARRRNEELRKEQEYYNTLSSTFDILIDKQKKLFAEKSGKDSMDAYKDALDMINSKQIANAKSLEAWFAQGASWRSHSNWYKYDKELGKVLSRQKLLNMSGEEWSDLLRNQPELWARLPEEVRVFAQSVMDASEQAVELGNALKESLAGFSMSELKSEFNSLFTQADLTFEDISDSFYNHMQKAILHLIQTKSMSEGMQKWYDNLVADLDDGELSASEAAARKKEYEALVEKGRSQYEAAMQAIGYSPEMGSSSQISSSGIERITEQTGSEIVGVARSQYDISKRNLAANEKILQYSLMFYDLFVASLRHQAAIEQNTGDTVIELKRAVTELKSINDNTKGGRYAG